MRKKSENISYDYEDKYGSEVGDFGKAKYFDEVFEPKKFSEQALYNHVLQLGWSHGCPQVRSCIETYGLEWMGNRYSSCNQITREVIQDACEMGHINLAYDLIFPVPREENEPVGKHEPLSVPKSHLNFIAGGSTLYGYAIPRLLLLKRDSKNDDSFIRSLTIQSRSLEHAHNLDDLLVKIIKALSCEYDVKWEDILSHALPMGILEEENCYTTYNRFTQVLIEKIPDLCKFYGELPDSQKTELGIADIPSLK